MRTIDVLDTVRHHTTELVLSHDLREQVLDADEGLWQISYSHFTQGALVQATCWLGKHVQVQIFDQSADPQAGLWRQMEDGCTPEQLAHAISSALSAALYFRDRAASQPSRHGVRRWRMIEKADRRERARTAYIPLD